MNIFCILFGHTWVAETVAPTVRWNTTKDGHNLVPTIEEKQVRHYEVCVRCGTRRACRTMQHDKDRPETAEA